jgi:RNA polymerase sigma-70 factor (ECF subfamily)
VEFTAICLILYLVPARAEPIVLDRASADAAAVARFHAGDQEAFEELVTRSEAEVYRLSLRLLGNREDALDATQDAFLRAFRALGRFRGEASFRTWLIGITLNVCRTRRGSASARIARRSSSLDTRDANPDEARAPDPVDARPNPEQAAHGAELGRALAEALDALTAEQREILLLREMQGLDYDELAQTLGCAEGTVKSRLSRARAALRAAMEGVWR